MDDVIRIQLDTLAPWSPFENIVWPGLDTPVTKEEVEAVLDSNALLAEPVPYHQAAWEPPLRDRHIRRIAYLVAKGWSDPIEIDVGVPSLGCYVDWIIQDGNHRLAAAFYLDLEYIEAGVSGSLDYMETLLGVTCTAS